MNKPTNILQYLLFTFLLFSFQSCYIDLDDDGIGCQQGIGNKVTEERILPDFVRVTNAIGANIILRQDQQREFRVTTHSNLLDDITTRVVNGELIIDYQGCYRGSDIDIFIATPQIEAVYNIGSGDIFGDNAWHSQQLDLRITGSGKIDAEVNAPFLFAEITGSGLMDLYGVATEGKLRITGSGDMRAFNLESSIQEISISGSGNCEVLTQDLLEVRISGSGNVYYKGRPQINTSITGSGGVFNAN
jgi:hypothetical protein